MIDATRAAQESEPHYCSAAEDIAEHRLKGLGSERNANIHGVSSSSRSSKSESTNLGHA